MKKKWTALLLALCLAASLAACGGGESGREEENQAAASAMPEGDLKQVSGTVLDAAGEKLILRTDSGLEYAMSLHKTNIDIEGGLVNGMRVDITYKGELSETGPAPRAVTITQGEAAAADGLHTGSTVDGSVVTASNNELTVRTPAGKEYVFATASAGQYESDQWLRITFDGEAKPGQASSGVVVKKIRPCVDQPDCYVFSAVLQKYDDETDLLKFRTDAGTEYEVSLADAETRIPMGFVGGGKLFVYYQLAGQPGESGPAPIRVLRVADQRITAANELYATVESWDDNGKAVLHTLDGRVLTFWFGKSLLDADSAEDGLQEGDGVKLTYTGALEGGNTANVKLLKVTRTAKAVELRNALTGTVKKVEDKALTLEADDGRTLRFAKLESADSLPEGLKKGDYVRVEFSGWLGAPQNNADASQATLARVTLALQ